MSIFSVKGLSVRYGSLSILNDVSFELDEGRWLMVVGPNGAGKSTLINAISQYVPYSGRVDYLGKNLKDMKARERARSIGVLSQSHYVGYSFTVGEVVRLGRYAYSDGIFRSKAADDDEFVRAALETTGLTALEGQSVLTLSGGELQRTFLAQIMAQDPQILLLDEPTNHLDLVYQKQTFELISQWLKHEGRAAVSVVHDLSLAKAYGTDALLLNKGNVEAYDLIDEVFSPANINAVYDMDVCAWMRSMLAQWV